MTRSGLISENITAALFALLTVLVCGYFVYAATQGPYGLYEKGRIEADESRLNSKLSQLIDQRRNAENRAKRLSDGFLDLDLLDEQSRRILGMVRDDEIIVR